MARTAAELQEAITFLKLRFARSLAEMGYSHLGNRIAYLENELVLQKALEARQSKRTQGKACANCHAVAPAADDFCTYCGTRLPWMTIEV